VSKAFTKEDDDAGFSAPEASSTSIPNGPFRLTPAGARRLASATDPRVRAALARAEIVRPTADPDRAALGVVVHARVESGEERVYRLVSPEERALLDDGCSIHSPLGRALLGATVGEVRELDAPRGHEDLEIVALERDA
jgi:transcription elongation GreA/GreB family factor